MTAAPAFATTPRVQALPVPAPSASAIWTQALQRTAGLRDDQTVTLADIIDSHATRDPGALALLAEGASLTYSELATRTNQYARWALAQGLRPGDTVCLMLPNSLDYLAIWLGLSRMGAVAALLNTQISGPSLTHCIKLASPKVSIVATAYLETYEAAWPDDIWTHGDHVTSPRSIEAAITPMSGAPLDPAIRDGQTLRDRALLIYTSGTTGLPKAANVSHYRIRMWSEWFAGLMAATTDDRLYNCLPMYHSIGGVAATGAMLSAGGAVVVREKFSASRFWDDIRTWDCTIFQYIGELCRYLVNQPVQPGERSHRLRLCCGNGLRENIWHAFQDRFAVPRVLEFYAATEGSFSLFNVEGRPGAIGKIPGFMAHRSPVVLVRYDYETGAPVRGPDGFCILCARGEAGEALGRLAKGETGLSTRFEGYTGTVETESKMLRGVFVKGDAWFRTGDLMRQDRQGFFYFVDRAGDTFRWKGENVATQEVEAVLGRCPGIIEANVYGVEVPGADGRAGMAALVTGPGFQLEAFYEFIQVQLPGFARPVFIRLCRNLAVTGTFKHQKHALVRQGFDPRGTDDAIYVHDAAAACYAQIDDARHATIASGALRL